LHNKTTHKQTHRQTKTITASLSTAGTKTKGAYGLNAYKYIIKNIPIYNKS